MATHGWRDERGTSLLEPLVAAAIVVTVAASTAHLLIWSRRAAWSAGAESAAVAIAAQKMEQLRSLAWHVAASGARVSDDTTNLAPEPPTAGGSGLRGSPPNALAANIPGFMDYVGADGRSRGAGAVAPVGAAYLRRWSVTSFADDPDDTLVLSVVVMPLADDVRSRGRPLRGARLDTLRTRTLW